MNKGLYSSFKKKKSYSSLIYDQSVLKTQVGFGKKDARVSHPPWTTCNSYIPIFWSFKSK